MKQSEIECKCIMSENLQRVKSITFHPCKKVLVAGLHSGQIVGYNYLYKTRIFELNEHEGPVRVVVFHHLIERFASGGDDCLIRIWNYKNRTVETVFKGHTDYIRSIEFHKQLPWLISTSDDQTIRIWNFQSKKQIACLTGHTHYVMGARFLNDSLFVSVSLDQTIRVWDYSALRTKSQSTMMDMLGVPEVIVKHILDGHDRGINWVAVKPESSIFATGGDDSTIRIWDASGDSVFETDTLQGHHSHVSSLYYTKAGILISNSEDGTMKIWDTKRRKPVETININNRFWSIAMNNTENILAAGYDTGLSVYSLEALSPVYTQYKGALYIKRAKDLLRIENNKEQVVRQVQSNLRSIYLSDVLTILNYPTMYVIKGRHEFKGQGTAIIHNDSLVISTGTEVSVKDTEGKEINSLSLSCTGIFSTSLGLIGSQGAKVFLIDFEMQSKLSCIVQGDVVDVMETEEHILVRTDKSICILDHELRPVVQIDEVITIQSVIYHEGTIFYTTPMHIKFGFISGECTALMSIDEPQWLVKVEDNIFTLINREGSLSEVEVDMVEWRFRYALEYKDTATVKECIKSESLLGQSSLGCLIRKGFYNEALQYIEDPEVKADLYIETKQLDKALECAEKLQDKSLYIRIGTAALNEDANIAEVAFRKGNDYTSLVLLYLSTNQMDKLDSVIEESSDKMLMALASIITGNTTRLAELINLPSTQKEQLSNHHKEKHSPYNISTKVSSTDKTAVTKESTQENSDPEDLQDNETLIEFSSSTSESHESSDNLSTVPGYNALVTEIPKESTEKEPEESSLTKETAKQDPKEKQTSAEETKVPNNLTNLPNSLKTLNRTRFAQCLKNIPEDIDTEKEIKTALEAYSEGKISSAINGFLVSLHESIKQIAETEEPESVSRSQKRISLCSMYLQALFAGRLRKKTQTDKTAISCALFVSTLPLEPSHKEKALKIAISVCYKKNNRSMAVDLAKELVEKYNCQEAQMVSLSKLTKSVTDAFIIDSSLPFCIDQGLYLEDSRQCQICKAWCSSECSICMCCFVSNMPVDQTS
ncbi:coatomer subunit alpha [Nematocida sp. AWRm80]|nr:coatomer subunit alpha [Nematocida sp. AWRm80]